MKLLKCLSGVQEICRRSPSIRSLVTPVFNVPQVEHGDEFGKISELERRQRYPVGILNPTNLESLKADELFLPKSTPSRRSKNSSVTLHPDRSHAATDQIFARVKEHLKCDETTFCLFNPGISNLPADLLEAGAKRIVILEAEDNNFDKWKRFAAKNPNQVWAHNFNFGRLAEHTSEQFIRTQMFPLASIFDQCGLQRNEEWKENGFCSTPVTQLMGEWVARVLGAIFIDPPIIYIGVLPPFNERPVFLCLLANRITRQNAFEFGPAEALLFTSASKYVVIGHQQAALPKLTGYRRQEYQLYFDFDLVGKEPFDSFHPTIVVPRKLKYSRSIEKCKLDPHLLHLVHMKPKRALPLDSSLLESVTVDHALAGLSFLHRQLLASPKATKLTSFLA
ncbi:hypothetical protein TTRE_0000136001 [Trichuris trichiura]|uniref:rRNA adenine N(6)-methyltransferase n=1 Tax=Trichuris trichiura TaxID=36087 RepID=A0A077YYB4_TRITR|nr:hypothetical protein TTRE_0000136001 [Trichuris trichiura]